MARFKKGDKRRLTIENVENPIFDWQKPRQRIVEGRPAIEWGTATDQFVRIGCTYFTDTGQLAIVCGEAGHRNVKLYDCPVYTQEQFAKAMRTVDRNYKKLRG